MGPLILSLMWFQLYMLQHTGNSEYSSSVTPKYVLWKSRWLGRSQFHFWEIRNQCHRSVWIQLAQWLQFTSKERLCNISGYEHLLTRVPTVLFVIGNNHRMHTNITGSPQKHVIKYFHFSKPCHFTELQMGKMSVAVSVAPKEKMDFSYHTACCTPKYTYFQMTNLTPSKMSDHSTKLNDGTVDYQFLLTTNYPGFTWVVIWTPHTSTAYSKLQSTHPLSLPDQCAWKCCHTLYRSGSIHINL